MVVNLCIKLLHIGSSLFSKYEHDNRPMIVVAGVRDPHTGSSITSEYWDFTVPDSVWEDTSK